MTFPISPGVYNVEQNYGTQVPTLGSTTGAFAGIFAWGPVFQPYSVASAAGVNQSAQIALKNAFGPPMTWNFETWYTAYNFLEYGNNLYIVRTANTTAQTGGTPLANAALNAVVGTTPSGNDILQSVTLNATQQAHLAQTGYPANTYYVAKYPSGWYGNSLAIGQCSSANQYNSQINLSNSIPSGPDAGNTYTGVLMLSPGSNVGTLLFANVSTASIPDGNTYANSFILPQLAVGDYFLVNTNIRGNPYQYLQTTAISNAVTNATVTTATINFTHPYSGGQSVNVGTINRYWEYWRQVTPPSTWTSTYQLASPNPSVADLLSVIIVDNVGNITGVPNTVLEVWNNLSRSTDALTPQGQSNYYRTVINKGSKWVWNVNDLPNVPSANSGSLVAVTAGSTPFDQAFAGGQDGDSETNAPMQTLINGWILFQGIETITIDLVLAGKATGESATAGFLGTTYYNFGMASWLISNLANFRKDCVLFFSPDSATVLNNFGNEATDIINWASLLPSSTYAACDTGYKQMYDYYNNVNRWVPLNGDIAGLCVYTDNVSYPWMSPAGFNRGQISNVIQLAYNPQGPDRDLIYPQGINPVVTFPSQGTYLYGGKTFTIQPTGFSRINVRRLFLVIERAIKFAAQYTLFELNDTFTQNAFNNMVTPYLSNIEGAGGIYDFLVVTGASVNTPFVINANEFLASIYVQPAEEIDFIQITYINTPAGVSFSTIEPIQA